MKTLFAGFLGTLLLFCGNALAQVTAGTGTAGKVPLWTGPHSQGNSVITQSGINIGIGTTGPTSPLTVLNGTASPAIYARGIGTGVGLVGSSLNNIGVWGLHAGTTGTQPGVRGQTASTDPLATGVFGVAGNGVGVYGRSTNRNGVEGVGGANGVRGECTFEDGNGILGVANVGPAAYAVYGISDSGSGVVGSTTGSGDAILGFSSGPDSYGGVFTSAAFRGGLAQGGGASFDFIVQNNGAGIGLRVENDASIGGNLTVAGSKSGYVVDHMQNADNVALEEGDVVVIADNSAAPLLGTIPVPRIKLATNANDSAVAGIVDRVTYVPSEKTRTAYQSQQQADREAASQIIAVQPGVKIARKANIQDRISDAVGTVHTDETTLRAEQGRYCSVVTLGAYKAVKVDANYGAIKPGDLLTTSWHAGYAMKVQDKVAASGAIIGKALGSLATGTGTIPVLVTLK